MKQRVISAIVFVLLLVPLIYFGALPFKILIYGFATIGLVELLKMRKLAVASFPGIISVLLLWILLEVPQELFIENFYSTIGMTKSEFTLLAVLILLAYTVLVKNKFTFDDAGFLLLSVIYVGMGFYYLILTRDPAPGTEEGAKFVFFVIFLVWATDTGAFFFGKFMGKHKLWPQISPKKTIEGSLGGVILAVIVGVIFQLIVPVNSSMVVVVLVSILVSISGQIGDLVESAFKRHYSVKDSGRLLPGHGGVLDRFDSLIFVLPILHFIQFIS